MNLTPEQWLSLSSAAVAQAVKHRGPIASGLTALLRTFGLGRPQIAVTGSPGVGKTVIRDLLMRRVVAPYDPPSMSYSVERAKIKLGRSRFKLVVLPGQMTQERRLEADALFSKGKVDGVVHVSAWGYASLRDGDSMRVAASRTSFAEFRRSQLDQETRELESITATLRDCHLRSGKPPWLILAVNKMDLYADKTQEAFEYYQNGPPAEILNRVRADIGNHRFQWVAVPLCAHPENFIWNDEVVRSQYDPDRHARDVRHFLDIMEKRCGV